MVDPVMPPTVPINKQFAKVVLPGGMSEARFPTIETAGFTLDSPNTRVESVPDTALLNMTVPWAKALAAQAVAIAARISFFISR